MHRKGTHATLCLVLLTLLAVLAAGCSGGDSQDQQGGNGGSERRDGGNQAGNAPETKIALGSVVFVNAEQRSFTLRPNTEGQNNEPVRFRLRPEANIRLDGEEASPQDMEQGQQAQVEYIVRNGSNRAQAVQLFSAGENTG